jgi:hypothetical protein
MTVEELGRIGYEAYGDHAEWKAFDGRPMPRWDDLRPDIKEKWAVAAKAIAGAGQDTITTGRMYPPTQTQEFGAKLGISPNLVVTGFLHGPFVIVVTNPSDPNDDAYPIVVCPDKGFETSGEAVKYIEKHYANRKKPYLGLNFAISPMWGQNTFGGFCSWED